MKKRMPMLAGTALLIAGPAQGAVTIDAIIDSTSAFLVNNNLISARIILTGWNQGDILQGFIGPPTQPWNVRTGDGSAFFNSASVPDPGNPGQFLFEDGYYAAPVNVNAFDTGLLGGANNNPFPANFGSPADGDASEDVGQFAMFSAGGNSDINIDRMLWLNLSTAGIVPPTTLNMMRLTWSRNTSATVSFLLYMNTPLGEQPMSITTDPGAPAHRATRLTACAREATSM